MKIKKDYSYGVIPVYKNDSGVCEFFILKQISYRGDRFWALPKGHPEIGETNEIAALRELKEESGLEASLEPSIKFTQQYSFIHEGVRVEKEVVYYLGWVEDKEFSLQAEEVAEAKWCSYEEAHSKLTHEASKATLKAAAGYLGISKGD